MNIIKEMKLSYLGNIRRHDSIQRQISRKALWRERERKEGRQRRNREQETSDWLENNIVEAGRKTIHRSACLGIIRVSAFLCQRWTSGSLKNITDSVKLPRKCRILHWPRISPYLHSTAEVFTYKLIWIAFRVFLQRLQHSKCITKGDNTHR